MQAVQYFQRLQQSWNTYGDKCLKIGQYISLAFYTICALTNRRTYDHYVECSYYFSNFAYTNLLQISR